MERDRRDRAPGRPLQAARLHGTGDEAVRACGDVALHAAEPAGVDGDRERDGGLQVAAPIALEAGRVGEAQRVVERCTVLSRGYAGSQRVCAVSTVTPSYSGSVTTG